MKDIIEKGLKEYEANKFRLNSLNPNSKEAFVKGVVDNIRKAGFEGDELFEKAAKELSGGRWVTIDGRHVYIKDGEVAAGTIYGKDGEKVTPGEKVASGGSGGDSKEESPKKDEKVSQPSKKKMPKLSAEQQKIMDKLPESGKVEFTYFGGKPNTIKIGTVLSLYKKGLINMSQSEKPQHVYVERI